MNVRDISKSVVVALAVQGLAFVVSCITSILLPKVLAKADYGYWQLFLFYGTYVGIAQFGVTDGVYLINGGKTREDLDKPRIGFVLRFLLASQVVVSILVAAVSVLTATDNNRTVVWLATSTYIVLANASSYFSYLLQAINETRRASLASAIDRGIFALPLVCLIIIRVSDFRVYIAAMLIGRLASTIYGYICCRDLITGDIEIHAGLSYVRTCICTGAVLVFANLAGNLVIGIVRQVIDSAWGIETFSEVSLSLSIVSFALTLISQVSMVLFPALRRESGEAISTFYNKSRSYLGVVLPVVYILYFPITLFVEFWLPQYELAIHYLSILLPICVFDGVQNICGATILKVLRKERELLLINCVAIVISACGALFTCYVLESVTLALASAVLAVIVRNAITERFLARTTAGKARCRLDDSSLGELVLSAAFVISTNSLDFVPSLLVSCILYSLHLYLMRETVESLIGMGKQLFFKR